MINVPLRAFASNPLKIGKATSPHFLREACFMTCPICFLINANGFSTRELPKRTAVPDLLYCNTNSVPADLEVVEMFALHILYV